MPIDTLTFWGVTSIYVTATLILGYIGYRKTKEPEDYMVAGRNAHPAIIALSYGATFISTSALIGFGGMAAKFGMGLIWLTVLNIGAGILIAFIVFGKKTREIGSKLRAITFPDLMGKRYRSGFMQYASAAVIIVGMPLYTAAILIGGARFIETTFQIPYSTALLAFALITALYVVIGGLMAVMYTNALHGVIMLAGMTILLILTYISIGGVVPAHQALTNMAPLVPETLAAQGHTGWTAMPTLGSPIWYIVITTLVLGVGIGVLAQPQLIVRFLTAKDSKSLNRAIIIGGPFILMMTGVAFTVGALTNVYFYTSPQFHDISINVVPSGNVDLIIPTFIDHAMPPWFVVLFMVTLLAASMSALSSLFHVMGTAIGYDIWQYTRSQQPSLKASQVGISIMIIVSVIVAFVLPESIIARTTAMFFGLSASALLPAFAYGIYAKNRSVTAAKVSLAIGALAWFVWTIFVHEAESSILGVSKFFFDRISLLPPPWSAIDPLVVALPISMIAIIVGHFLCQPLRRIQ